MAFTQEQKDIIKADILANPDLSALPETGDGSDAIANLYNLPASPDYIVWRTNVPVEEIMSNGFVWTAVDSLTVGKARIWDWMTRVGFVNPSKSNVRQGIADCFGAASAMVAGILPHCKRKATRLEKLLATGAGTDASPSIMSFEGTVSYWDIERAKGR